MRRVVTAAAVLIVSMGSVAAAGDPTTLDCLTANESSLTLRNHLDLRATRAQLLVCSSASCPADIRNECIRRMGEVNLAMPTIVFEAKDAGGHNLLAVTVKMDGELLAERLEGTSLSIDPGQHTFTFEVPGQPAVQQEFLILQGEKDRRERIVFETIGKRPAIVPARADARASDRVAPANAGRARFSTAQRLSFVLGGVGLAGIAVGTGFGLAAISRRNAATAVCPDRCAPEGDGVALWNRASSAGDIATVAFVVGAAGLAGGVTLWIVGSSAAESAPAAQLSLGPRAVQVVGRW